METERKKGKEGTDENRDEQKLIDSIERMNGKWDDPNKRIPSFFFVATEEEWAEEGWENETGEEKKWTKLQEEREGKY